jgi:hypothetical protein
MFKSWLHPWNSGTDLKAGCVSSYLALALSLLLFCSIQTQLSFFGRVASLILFSVAVKCRHSFMSVESGFSYLKKTKLQTFVRYKRAKTALNTY